MKYTSLAELKAAYESGELSRQWKIRLDNDSTAVDVGSGSYDELQGWEHSERVFDSLGPAVLLEEALTLLGIPWDNA